MKNLIILFTTLFLLVFVSCDNQKSKNSFKEGEISINLGGEPRTLDPTLNSLSFGSIYMIHFFEGLTKRDIKDNVVPGMAESWDISKDGLKYTFHLRTNAKWSDGKSVIASDFEYALKRAANPKTAATYSHMLNVIKNARLIISGKAEVDDLQVKALDDYTLEIILENPTPYFLEYISVSSPYFPVRKDIIETYGDNWSRNPETYIVNGPYIMTERKQDEKIVMEVNSNYYDKDYIVAEKINILIMDDSNTALAAMKNGDLQFSVIEAPMGEIPSLMKENYILQEPAYGIYFLEINSQKGVLTNKNIRKALSLAFDRNYIISNVTKMNQIPAGAFVSPNLKDYDGKDFRANGGNYIDIDNYQNNVDKAKKLMADAGYPNGENFPVLEIRTTPGYFTLICEAIQDMYRSNLGIDILIKSEEYNATYQAMIQKDYDLARTGWTADFSEPMAMLNFFSKTSAVNHTGFESEEFNNLLEFASKTQNQKERMEALHKAENILFDYMPVIPIIYRMDPFMISPKLKGAIFNPLGRYKFNYAYIEK
ncbi:peptide ABC transporter substrate-binding protein [Brachyspira aalborgi]|uniref:Peptide ABC transporter substrate-binding protein n=1 Tax=Brachyspira aalborgi TaxID=29522 RepID=A0A5C8D508_9SPIR|nr:peptide ABC transporter substrate-binding protein [Brachyspira aalborgi]TXJ20577.1 peptide ABC transporter substrate-binding protein [Brachyspira aalborgi]